MWSICEQKTVEGRLRSSEKSSSSIMIENARLQEECTRLESANGTAVLENEDLKNKMKNTEAILRQAKQQQEEYVRLSDMYSELEVPKQTLHHDSTYVSVCL